MKRLKLWEKRLEQALERVSRKTKLAVNLSVTLLLLLLGWARMGYPVLTAEMEYRRMERANLLSPGEIVFTVGEDDWSFLAFSSPRSLVPVCALDGTQLHLQGRWFISRWEDRAAASLVGERGYDRFMDICPLEPEGAAMLPLHGGYGLYYTEGRLGERVTNNFAPLVLVDVPEETSRAEIALQTAKGLCVGEGWNMGNGVWILTPDNQMLDPRLEQEWPYTLALFRADGSVLLERSEILEW